MDLTNDLIGFFNLSNQIHRKIIKRGFEFTLMIVGESGLGKKTLINNLFLTNLSPEHRILTIQEKLNQTVKLDISTFNIQENDVKIRLTIITTHGFNDCLNMIDNYQVIVDYVDKQFERYLNDENGFNRRTISDNRVHCLLYLISSLTRGLKPLDIECMKALHKKVNLIPIIARADSLTSNELVQLKRNIIEQISKYKIEIYRIPKYESDDDDDEQLKTISMNLKDSFPFAIISSNNFYEHKGKYIHGRMYPWGLINIENSNYSDLGKLRTLIITYMQDLQDITHDVHYEKYRSGKIFHRLN